MSDLHFISDCFPLVTMISIFPLSFSHDIDDGLISFIRLLLYDLDWNKAHKKGRIPRAIIDEAVAGVLHEIINQRLAQYKENIDVSQCHCHNITACLLIATGNNLSSFFSMTSK